MGTTGDATVLPMTRTTDIDREAVTSSYHAADLAGITYRQLDYWARTGVVTPEHAGRGSGSARRWTAHEVSLLAVVGRLAALGLGRDVWIEAVEYLRTLPLAWWPTELRVDLTGDDVVALVVNVAACVVDL